MEVYGRREVHLLLIHDLGHRWGVWSASRPGLALPPGEGPPVPIGREIGWASEPVWTQRLEEKSPCLYRESNLDRPVRSQALLIELPGSILRIYPSKDAEVKYVLNLHCFGVIEGVYS
jgi:hypothetical protein